jgi:CRP-like cAMP-binding protein
VEEGDYIAKPGQTPDQIYFLAEGQMEASITINDKDLNHRRIAMYRLKKDGSSRSTGWDLRNALLNQSALKPGTEMYPVLGPTGVEGAVHSTEKDSGQHKILGRHCVELVLDTLGPGSPIGCFTAMSSDQFTLQVKALGKCSCYVLPKSVLSHLRKSKTDLHQQLLRYETWAKTNTPLIDDYILANDAERGLEFKMNEHKSRYRLRGTVLRVIKENRDRRLTDTPLIALMLKTIKFDPKIRNKDVKNKSLRSFAQSLLQKTFDPKVRQQLLKHHDLSNVSTEVAGLAYRLVGQQENLQGEG